MAPLIAGGAIVMREHLPFSRRAEQSMGMPAASQPYWTASMVRELPDDGKRYECIDGELLVTPSPGNPHQWVVGELYQLLAPYVRGAGVGLAQISPLDVELDDGMIVQPDILAYRPSPLIAQGRIPGRDLILTVEVLSPSTKHRDRGLKRDFYARIGVAEYWIVDPAVRQIERWRSGATTAEREDGNLVWQPAGAAKPFTIDLPAFFDDVPVFLRAQQ